MKRLGRRIRAGEEAAEVNLAPFMDVVFILLIFFVVTAVFVEETGLDIQRPAAAAARDLDRESVMIAIAADGRIGYAGVAYPLSAVRGLVARELARRPMPVILLADRSAPSGLVVDVIDECKLAGAKTVSLAARREP